MAWQHWNLENAVGLLMLSDKGINLVLALKQWGSDIPEAMAQTGVSPGDARYFQTAGQGIPTRPSAHAPAHRGRSKPLTFACHGPHSL